MFQPVPCSAGELWRRVDGALMIRPADVIDGRYCETLTDTPSTESRRFTPASVACILMTTPF